MDNQVILLSEKTYFMPFLKEFPAVKTNDLGYFVHLGFDVGKRIRNEVDGDQVVGFSKAGESN